MKTKDILLSLAIGLMLMSGCQPAQKLESNRKEVFIDSLMNVMTLDEKIGQMTLYTSGWDVTGPVLNSNYMQELKQGRVGGLFNAHTVKYDTRLQRIAVDSTRLGIPLLFGYDVIHGYKTIFPIPLAESCSWDMDLIRRTAQASAKEAASAGVNWTYNPMVDISRDPRWGRVAEGAGEDPYLGSQIAVAKVKGYQGSDLSDHNTLAACVKHFAAYGAAEAGRDYNTVDMSERRLRDMYLPPYKAAVDAGVATVMTSFNVVDGIPATGNHHLLTDILRKEWGFKGFVVTDYTSINEMVPHGIVKDEKAAAALAVNAGVDMDMQGGVFNQYLKSLLKEGKVKEATIDDAVKRILALKWDLGLFENPFRYLNAEREKTTVLSQPLMDLSLEAGHKSAVLLKNDSVGGHAILPLQKQVQKIAVIGPLADNQLDLLGTWHSSGDETKVVTLLKGIQEVNPEAKVTYAKGCGFEGDDKSGFSDALAKAKNADVVILAIGENYRQSGEAASRSNIDLPGVQPELVKAIMQLHKPTVAVVMAGRPLTISWMNDHVPAILYSWHLGTMSGRAIADILFGDYNPSGRLAMSFPRNVGQIPIYYNAKNTGRPFNPDDKYTSKYLDVPNTPLYPFGYGLSYTHFEYSKVSLDKPKLHQSDSIKATVTIKNTGKYKGEEVVQLYIHDLVGSVTRPVKELKGFRKISLAPGEEKEVSFYIKKDMLRFYDKDMQFKAEPGDFDVYIGPNAASKEKASFVLE